MALAALGAFAHAVLSLSMRSWPSLRSVHSLMLCCPCACAHGPRCARCIRSCSCLLVHALMALAALGAFAHAVLSLSMRSWPSLRSVHSLMLVPPCACAHGPRCARCIRSCCAVLEHALMALAALGAFAHARASLCMR